jgi:hypothetical protein
VKEKVQKTEAVKNVDK